MTTARRRLLLANGVFLVVVGGVQVVFELLAYYAGVGPYGYIFEESPYAIGWVEAHGLAFIIGVLLLTVAVRDLRRFWHVLAAAHIGALRLVIVSRPSPGSPVGSSVSPWLPRAHRIALRECRIR